MKLSVVMPVYNERETIENIVEKVKEVDIDKEIILVDDGSIDGTREFLTKILVEAPDLKVVFHDKNEGKGAALRTGFMHASGDYVIVQDADLEYDPQDFHKLLKPVIEGKAKVVYGSRFMGKRKRDIYNKGSMHFLHLLANKTLTFLTNVLYGAKLTDMETCYKLIPKNLVESITITSNRFNFEPEITAKILKKGYKIVEVPISYAGRDVHEGKKIGWKDGIVALWTLIKYRFVD